VILKIGRPGVRRPTTAYRGSESFREHICSRVAAEDYWFHKIQLFPDLITPGWSDPLIDKLPHFGLPADLTGRRVLDIGTAEGFFAFEAERRGAEEVVAIDSAPDSVRRFNICRDALGSKATAYLTSVYDLNPRTYGTFDMVFFFGVLYHLRNPLLALEKVLSVSCGTVLMQTATREEPSVKGTPIAWFHPLGLEYVDHHGTTRYDPTVFWIPNAECAIGMLRSVGFENIEIVSREADLALRASAPTSAPPKKPDPGAAPWS